ncbi:MAG: LytTR family transcriptional regulator DNA-binding domain-containing protein [Rhizobacter sp.]|nr:LytTR family transcriptional regulator DNA-binding domain-containing protein [Ferruginibacter sp.]
MQTQFKQNDLHTGDPGNNPNSIFPPAALFNLDLLIRKMEAYAGKKSFLVFKHNKYFTVPTESIAFFYVKYEASIIVCFDRQEYLVSNSLEQIGNLVTGRQFFRVNRQYLVNFAAVKEVEHYFARKLLVNLTVPSPDKLLVPKDKSALFLQWLENR